MEVGRYWIGSHVSGSQEAITDLQENNVHSYQRPDADHVELDPLADTLHGHAGAASFSKIAGERTRMAVNLAYKSPGFEVNDVGFLRRADEIPQNSWLQIRWDKPGKYVRTTRINFNQWSSHNFDGDRLSLGFNFNGHWTFQNYWSTGFGVNANTSGFDDRLTRGGPGGPQWEPQLVAVLQHERPQGREPQLELELRQRSARVAVVWHRAADRVSADLRAVDGAGCGLQRQQERLSVGGGGDAERRDALRVRAPGAEDELCHDACGLHRDAHAVGAGLRTAVRVVGRYEIYKELVNGRAEEYVDRFAPYAYQQNADFKVRSFRTTNVLRWEFKPG